MARPSDQARNVEEDVPAAVIGAQKAEALGLEIRDDRAGLLAGGRFRGGVSARPVDPEACGGLLVLSPTPCLIRARSASDQSAGGWLSAGILRSGLRFRASSNILFWRAFKRIILDTRAYAVAGAVFLRRAPFFSAGGCRSLFFKLPITIPVTNFFSP